MRRNRGQPSDTRTPPSRSWPGRTSPDPTAERSFKSHNRQQLRVAPEAGQRLLVTLRRLRLAGIGETHHPVAAVSGILDGVIDALIGEQARHHQGANADVAQEVIRDP